MSAVQEVQLTAAREFRRNLRSTKGIAMIVLFLVGGTILPLLQTLAMLQVKQTLGNADFNVEQRKTQWKNALEALYDADIAKYLVDCPPILYFLFWGTASLVPFFILMIGFDQISGDVQHRTLRYMTGRAHRGAIVVGKALGLWGVISAMILVLYMVVWVIAMIQGIDPVSAILLWGLKLWVYSAFYTAAYVGLVSLISSFFRTPVVGLFFGLGVLIGMVVLGLILRIFKGHPTAGWVYQGHWALPSSYFELLLKADPVYVASGLAALVGWGALCVTAAAEVVRRRDI